MLRTKRTFIIASFLTAVLSAEPAHSQSNLPLLQLSDFQYTGAFRIPSDDYSGTSINYNEGPLAYSVTNNSIFIVGHSHHQRIGEFRVPAIVNSTNLSNLAFTGGPLQTFVETLGRVPNPQDVNRIGGMAIIPGATGPELVVNGYEYYDADGSVNDTSLVFRNPVNLAGSRVDGFFSFNGGSGHTSGWLSPIPQSWQSALGGGYITGQSSGIPIISRTSVGPSAFAFNPAHIVGNVSVPNPIPTIRLLDFSLENPLHADLSNDSRTNQLWTHLSRVTYGFIAPGTRTYVTVGSSGGHASGVCYKCTQDNGNVCGGYCSRLAADNHRYYWLWDVNHLVDVKEGRRASHSVRPYASGVFPGPFNSTTIGGGSFDPGSGKLFLTLQGADDQQDTYAYPPVVAVYRINNPGGGGDTVAPSPPQAFRVDSSS